MTRIRLTKIFLYFYRESMSLISYFVEYISIIYKKALDFELWRLRINPMPAPLDFKIIAKIYYNLGYCFSKSATQLLQFYQQSSYFEKAYLTELGENLTEKVLHDAFIIFQKAAKTSHPYNQVQAQKFYKQTYLIRFLLDEHGTSFALQNKSTQQYYL